MSRLQWLVTLTAKGAWVVLETLTLLEHFIFPVCELFLLTSIHCSGEDIQVAVFTIEHLNELFPYVSNGHLVAESFQEFPGLIVLS